MSDRVYVGPNTADLDYDEKAAKITRVNLSVDSDHIYTSGDDTGRTLEVSCPWGTQAMADNILAKVCSVEYRPYEASDALLDPAAEIGDGITIGGIYSVLAQSSVSLDKQCAANIAAPYTDEIDDEYPYKTQEQRKAERLLAYTRSLISKTSEEIRLEVADDLNDLSASIDIQLESIVAEVEGLDGRTASLELGLDGISAQVTDNTNSVAALEMYVDSLTLSVSNGSTSSTIKLMAGSAEIASQTINMTGLVTYTGLSSGTTTIDGACIKTGAIDAERLNLTGAITWSDLSGGVQSNINSAYSLAQSVESDLTLLANGQYKGGTFIDGTTIYSPTLMGDEIILMDGNSYKVGSISLVETSTYAFDITSNLSLRMQSAAGYNAYLSNGASGDKAAYVLLANGGQLSLNGNPITINSANYGSSLPTGEQPTGRLFFLTSS